MKLFDSLSKYLKPIDKDEKIKIYNCGPTVYNHIHIGNAAPMIFIDVLHRYLLFKKYDVQCVSNITDIDDKIIAEAEKQNMNELDLSNKYFLEFEKIKKELKILPVETPKVSEHLEGIKEYIQKIIDTGSAYVVDGNVYFDTKTADHYGVLSNRDIKENSNSRLEADPNKKSESDFLLWKKTSKGLKWDSKWSQGRPGWHTECSYLINHYFGKQASIHCGGMDLKFPHHENENVQNLALTSEHLAKIWLHAGMINVNNEKMSKSLNNFVLVKDLLKSFDYRAIKWFFYQSKMSQPVNFSKIQLEMLEDEINKIKDTINKSKTFLYQKLDKIVFQDNFLINRLFETHIENNLNLPNAVSLIQSYVKTINYEIKQKAYCKVFNYTNDLILMLKLLGIEFPNIHTKEWIAKIKKWYVNHKAKNFEVSDKLRDEIIEKELWK